MSARRSGSAIVAALLLVAIGVVIAATVLAAADAASATSRGEASRTQSRALAWSGVQAVMVELAEQRDSILAGAAPQVTPEWDLYTLDDGTHAVVRLVDLTPDAPGELASENAKLDLNASTKQMLARVQGLDAAMVDKILAARGARPFSSVEQLLSIEGISANLLYGSPASAESGPFDMAKLDAPVEPAAPAGLSHSLTVFSFDPNVQLGLGGEADAAGAMRVNLDQPWSDRLRAAIADRMGDPAAEVVGSIMRSGRSFTRDSDLVQVLRDLGADPADWIETLDIFTTSDDEFLPGRVDVNLAPPAVLACIPGITPEQAGHIATVRESLDAQTRSTPVWLVTEGVLTPDEFEQAIDFITTRSTQWRARIEVGIEAGDGDGSSPGVMTIDELSAGWDQPPTTPRLGHRMVIEAVIDIGSSRPRVAYLRDVTLLDEILAWPSPEPESEETAAPTTPVDEAGSDPSAQPTEEDPWSLDEDFAGLDFGLDEPPPGELPAPVAPASAGAATTGPQAGPESGGPVDRRIGRWSTRQGGKR